MSSLTSTRRLGYISPVGEAPYGANMFLWCWAGWDHTDAVGLHVASIRADDNKGLVSIVYMKEDKDGRNNNREGEKEERTAGTNIGVS